MPKTKGCGTHLPRSVDCPSRQAHQGRSGASIAPTHGRFDDAVRAQPAKGSYDPSARLRRLRRALAGSTALVAVALVGTLLVAAPPAFADDGTRPAFGVGGTGGVSGVHGSQGRGRGGLGGAQEATVEPLVVQALTAVVGAAAPAAPMGEPAAPTKVALTVAAAPAALAPPIMAACLAATAAAVLMAAAAVAVVADWLGIFLSCCRRATAIVP